MKYYGTISDDKDLVTKEYVDNHTGITDVTQNGTSVVSGGIAAVTVPTKTSDLNNDSGFITEPTWSALTLTRTNNSYVNATNFARMSAFRLGNLGLLYVNLQMSASMPNNTAETTIGKITGATITRQVLQTIPCQSNNATIMFDITTAGNIMISNYSGTATGTNFFRAMIPFCIS